MSSSAPLREDDWSTVSKGSKGRSLQAADSAPSKAPTMQEAPMCWASLFETPRMSPGSRCKSPAPSHTQALRVLADAEPIVVSWRSLQAPCRMRNRGLLNTGNMCFLNAILQGLIHCAPLANLLRSIPARLLEALETPYLLALSRLLANFYADVGGLQAEDPVIPEHIIDAIRMGSSTEAFQGEQEDAQEFLTFLLDNLHQEFSANQQLLNWQFSEATSTLFRSETLLQADSGWMEVGPKQRVSETRTMAQSETPISFLFAGQFRSTVRRPRAKDSITFEPFNCLPLEVHHRHIGSLEEALAFLARPERIDGGDAGLTKSVTISRLPMILVIQLKRFLYNQDSGRIEKLQKHIMFPEKLVLPPSCYSQQAAGSSPTYRLTAVIHHHGRFAEGGHYTADVRKSFRMDEPWQRINDASIQAIPLETVLAERRNSDAAPYLLIYQRYKDSKHAL